MARGPRRLTPALLLDSDPGVDDAVAILLAARAPAAGLVAVCTSYGNTTLERATRNAHLVLERAGADVPVFPGPDRPLVRAKPAEQGKHGSEGLGTHRPPPPPAVQPTGAEALLRALASAPGPVVLVTLGPLTSLALAFESDPGAVRERVSRHVAAASLLAGPPGAQGPEAEYNIRCDPEAASAVLAARLGTELVPVELGRRLALTTAAVAALASHTEPEARWLGELLGGEPAASGECRGAPSGPALSDALAVTLALEPSWGRSRERRIHVDLSRGVAAGRTTPGGPRDPLVRVYQEVHLGAATRLLLDLVFGRWLDADAFRS